MEPQEIAECDAALGVIGGSGVYAMEGLDEAEQIRVETPYGPPSDLILCGRMAGRRVCFLPRHGRGHRLLAHEVNHRANIWALRSLGVRWLLSVTAVGSLREDLPPRQAVVPDQLLDRTGRAHEHTFFGEGIAAHVSFAEPYSPSLRRLVLAAAAESGATARDGGTYVCMNGPAFSTRAESAFHRSIGCDVVGMTNAGEARLCREAEIAAATLALVTDYDCWKTDEDPVDAATVLAHLAANRDFALSVVRALVPQLPRVADWPEHRSLDAAIMTPRGLWPEERLRQLAPLLSRRVGEA